MLLADFPENNLHIDTIDDPSPIVLSIALAVLEDEYPRSLRYEAALLADASGDIAPADEDNYSQVLKWRTRLVDSHERIIRWMNSHEISRIC